MWQQNFFFSCNVVFWLNLKMFLASWVHVAVWSLMSNKNNLRKKTPTEWASKSISPALRRRPAVPACCWRHACDAPQSRSCCWSRRSLQTLVSSVWFFRTFPLKLHLRNPKLNGTRWVRSINCSQTKQLSLRWKSWQSQHLKPGQLGEERERYLCAMPPPWQPTLAPKTSTLNQKHFLLLIYFADRRQLEPNNASG